MSDLSFDALREANIERCVRSYHPVQDWTFTDWATAAAGEMGEVCGVVKKLRRLDPDPERSVDLSPALGSDLADEIADTVIYLDLLAARAGFSLGAAIRRKFNRTSVKVGSAVKL